MEEFERPYRQVSRIKAVTLFLLHPRAFLDYSAKHDISWVISKSPDIRERYLKGEYKPDMDHTRSNVRQRAEPLRKSLFAAGIIVGLTALIAATSGLVFRTAFGALPAWLTNAAQGTAAGLILWATLWELTKGLQSYGGESLPERVHSWLFRLLYTVGTFLFFLVYTWQS